MHSIRLFEDMKLRTELRHAAQLDAGDLILVDTFIYKVQLWNYGAGPVSAEPIWSTKTNRAASGITEDLPGERSYERITATF